MLFVVEDGVEEIPIHKYDSSCMTLGYIGLPELEQCYEKMHFSAESIADCKKDSVNFRTSYCICEEYIYCKLHIVDLQGIMSSNERIAIFVKRNLCLFVGINDPKARIYNIIDKLIVKYKQAGGIEKFLFQFFDELLRFDNKGLEDIEFELNMLEDTIVTKRVPSTLPHELLKRKRELFVLRNYYEELTEYSEVLMENELGIFAEENLKYLTMLNNKTARLKQNTFLLRENLVQLREAYQSYLDYSLNSIVKVFTVVTTIFSPLTLIVGWYGMNFTSMPEYAWKYGYVFVISLTITVLLICYWFFKKNKFL